MKVNRAEILRQLEACSPGLSNTDNIEQANCFMLTPGRIVTFNDEICCTHDTTLTLTCAVPAKPLLETLRRLSEDEVDIEYKEDRLLLKCANVRKIGINVHADVVSHAEAVEPPGEWIDVPPVFADALAMVAEAAAKESDQFSLCCVQISPNGMQATDSFQAIRYKLPCPVTKNILVKKTACAAVNGLGIACMSETPNWVHWKTYTGLQVSVRKYAEEFPDLGEIFRADSVGTLRFPHSLIDSLQKAAAFLADTGSGKQAVLRLKTNKLMIRGQNENGFYEEIRDIAYDGPSISFGINPKYVQTLLKHDYPCNLTDSALRIRGESFSYITSKENVL